MDANFFRFLIRDIPNPLKGKRIEKIYNPFDGLWTFKLSGGINLLFLFGRTYNFLCLSKNRPENPLQPSPYVGWWRKRTKNRWIREVVGDWSNRKLFLGVGDREDRIVWIVLDLRDGFFLSDTSPSLKFCSMWPPLEEVLTDKEIYKKYPHITSPLRYSLLGIASPEAREDFYSKLISGEIDTFYVYENLETKEIILSLWPRDDLSNFQNKKFLSSIEAAEYYGWSILNRLHLEDDTFSKKREKRLKKRLEKEKKRLEKWVSLEKKASLIKEYLYLFEPDKRYPYVQIPCDNGENIIIELDPSITLVENMALMFKRAKKGKRGLIHLNSRLNETYKSSMADLRLKDSVKNHIEASFKKKSLPSRLNGLEVKVYKSSDGFYIVRGKNQRANHKLLTVGARAHDVWFHVQGGPGAHVVVIKNNPKDILPQTTIEEASILAGLASYQKQSKYAEVIGTEVRYVKKIKGMALGQVEVSRIIYSLRVSLDPLIEERLRVY